MSNEWIKWNGKITDGLPLQEGTLVDAQCRNGYTHEKVPFLYQAAERMIHWEWSWKGVKTPHPFDIVAVRLSEVSQSEINAGQLQDGTKIRELREYDPAPLADLTMDAPGYERLAQVLMKAYLQAADGKGAERHANDLPFHEQPMQSISQMVGVGFTTGQVIKKTQEAVGMLQRGNPDAAMKEMLGAIVYLAGAIIYLEDSE